MNVIEVKAVKKDYSLGKTTVHALRGIDLTVEKSAFCQLLGLQVAEL